MVWKYHNARKESVEKGELMGEVSGRESGIRGRVWLRMKENSRKGVCVGSLEGARIALSPPNEICTALVLVLL